MSDLNKRPFPRERKRALEEEVGENCLVLRPREQRRQSTYAHMLIGACWIGLLTKVEEFKYRRRLHPTTRGRVAHARRGRSHPRLARSLGLGRGRDSHYACRTRMRPPHRACRRAGTAWCAGDVQSDTRPRGCGGLGRWHGQGPGIPEPTQLLAATAAAAALSLVSLLAHNALPAARRANLEPHPPIGQGRRGAAKDDIEQLLDRQAGDPGVRGRLAHAEPDGRVDLLAASDIDHDTHPRLIGANGVGIEPQARGQVFERVGDVGSVGDRRHGEASRG